MSDTYTVYIENAAENTQRELEVEDRTPMDAHKSAYMKVTRYEEIQTIKNSNGDTVFDSSNGFSHH